MNERKAPWQRLLSLLLCAAMVLSFAPTAWATEAESAEQIDAVVDALPAETEAPVEAEAVKESDVEPLAEEPVYTAAAREDDVTTFLSDGIKFNLFNYSDHINKVIKKDGTYAWDPIVQYFSFRGGSQHYNVDPNAGSDEDPYKANRTKEVPANMPESGATTADGTPILGLSTTSGYNPQVDTDGFTKTHATLLHKLDDKGNPVLDLANDALGISRNRDFNGTDEGTGDLFAGVNSYNLGYLFDPDTTHHGVTAYEPKNLPLKEIGQYQYYYNSKDNAVDYDIENNLFRVRSYVERTSSTASYTGFSDFLPFTYTGGVVAGTNSDTKVDYHVNQYDNDYWFGVTMEVDFYMTKDGMLTENGQQIPMEFFFSGDDDVWVFVDNALVLDLGGTHGTVDGSINFATGKVRQYLSWQKAQSSATNANVAVNWSKYVNEGGSLSSDGVTYAPLKDANGNLNASATSFPTTLKERFTEAGIEPNGGWDEDNVTFADYTKHTLKFFYLERGSAVANCKLDFRLPVLPNNALLVTKDLTVDGEDSEAEIIQNTLTYGFRVWETDGAGNKTNNLFIKPFTKFDIVDGSLNVVGSGEVDKDGIFYLKANQTARFLDMLKQADGHKTYVVEEILPAELRGQYGTVEYTVGTNPENTVERDETTYYSFYSKELSAEDSQAVTYRNRVQVDQLSELHITKAAHASSNIADNKLFTMKVLLGGELLPVGTKYTLDGAEKTVTEAGVIQLTVGQEAVIEGILSGTEFTVYEDLGADVASYSVVYTGTVTSRTDESESELTGTGTGISGKFPIDSVVRVTVTNQNVDFGIEILINKTAAGNTGDASFSFNVEAVEKNGDEWTVVKSVAGTNVTVNGASGTAKVFIGYESDTPTGNYCYKVTEQAGSGPYEYDQNFYIVEVEVQAGSQAKIKQILKNGTEKVNTITFVNQKITSIQVKKVVYGIEAENKDAAYSINVSWNGGSETLSLKNNETKQVNGIPVGADVTVTETTTGFEVYVKTGTDTYAKGSTATVTAEENNIALVTFANLGQFARPDTVVIDFGLPVDVDVLSNDIHGANTTVTLDKTEGTYGTASVKEDGSTVRYQVGSMSMTAEDKFGYSYAYTPNAEIDELTVKSELTIIPATSLYYEDSFVEFKVYDVNEEGYPTLNESEEWDKPGFEDEAVQAADRVGDALANLYGYDAAYGEMNTYSLGSARKLTVSKKVSGEALFTFTGTGFDVISLTSSDTGTILVTVTDKETGKAVKRLIVDTYYGYKYEDDQWIADPQDNNALYQIPVMKVEGLEYGTYNVSISASYLPFWDHNFTAGDPDTEINDSYDIYVDAIRVYNPAQGMDDYYQQDGEGWPAYQELRNLLIEAEDFSAGDTVKGAIFIDNTNAKDGKVYNITEYRNYGPNNEVYLAADQAVAFKLKAEENIADIQLALKSVGGTAKVNLYGVAEDEKVTYVLENAEIKTATDLYRSILAIKDQTIVIQNAADSETILSITNIKTTYNSEPGAQTNGVELQVDLEAAQLALGALEQAAAKPVEPVNPFADVEEGDYFYDAVLWAVGEGITNGMSENLFAPESTCTRGQVVTFLWRAAGSPAPSQSKSAFVDVKAGAYYYDAVLWAVENNITNGMDATHFDPEAKCSRGQVVTFLYRAMGKPTYSGNANPFADVKVTDYYYDAVLWAVENNITNGMGGNVFAPENSCNRGQVVTFLYRAYK